MITEILISISAIFAIIGAIGFFRFPDFYTRIHAATMITIGGTCLALIALAIDTYTDPHLNITYTIKILMITIFILLTNPTGSHALADSAYRMGIIPKDLKKNDLEKKT